MGDTVPDFSSVRGEIGRLPERGTLDELRGELAQSPRMQAGRLSVDLGAAQLEVEKSKRYPDITLNTGVARDYEAGRNKVQFGVGIPLPLFDRNQGNVYAATMRSYKARDQYRDLEARLAAELLQSVSQYDLATGTANDYRATVLPSARRAYDIALKGFEAGKVGYLQVLDAQRTRSQAELGYLAALTNAHQAWATSIASSDADSHYAMTMQILRFPGQFRARLAAALLTAASLLAATSAAADEKPASAGHADHAPTEKGPQGGVLTRAGGNGVELLVSESSGSSRLRLWAYAGSKPVAAGEIKARVRLLRPNGAEEELRLESSDGALVSAQDIPEPHYFEIEAEASWPGQAEPLKASLEKDEGLIPLTAEQVAAAGIRSAAAAPAALEATSQFPGEIKFNADRTAHIVPRLAGVAQEAPVELGQMVKKGELLAALSSTALSDLRSEWLAAVKRRDLAAATHQRELKLWREQVTAEQDYQQARTALQEAQIAVQNAEQKLAAVGATPRAKDLSRLEIRAPFDGVIVEKHITLGEALADNVNIFTLSDLGTVWAEFSIAAKDLQDVRVGEAARVSSAAFTEARWARCPISARCWDSRPARPPRASRWKIPTWPGGPGCSCRSTW